MSGSIPSELGNLVNLRQLYLTHNQLSGQIPAALGGLDNLVTLNLYHNQLSGSIPVELGNMDSLMYLRLRYNELSGTIPSELGNLGKMNQLELQFNELSGAIPSELGNLDSLWNLNLDSNRLSGAIPSELGNLVNVRRFDLSGNQLSGPIPAELGNVGSQAEIHHIYLSGNQLSGCIPDAWRNIDRNDFHRLGLPFCSDPTHTPTATATPDDFTSSGSGTESDPFIIADPVSVSARSIRSYVASLQVREYVYFQWEVGTRSGSWTISSDATPTDHDFDLHVRDDQGNSWDDSDTSYDGDESVSLTVQANGHILLAVRNYDGGAPTDLTLTIEPPASG